MLTVVTEILELPNGEVIPVEWFDTLPDFISYNRVLIPAPVPTDCPLIICSLSLN